MTKQQLEKQNKDLRTRLENAAIKMEIERTRYKAEITQLNQRLAEKEGVIRLLQKDVQALESTMEERLKALVAQSVSEVVTELESELMKANGEITRQRAIINKDSTNSSKPPSSNGFKTIPNNRERSGLKPGGQINHPGHRLCLPPNIDELEKQGIVERRVSDHTNGAEEYVTKYTIDLSVKVIITEHRYSKDAILPISMYNEVSYGNSLRSTALLLMNEGIVAEKRLSEIISSQTHGAVNLSTGTLNKFQTELAESVSKNGDLEQIKQDLLNGEVMNTDDTPLRTLERIVYTKDSAGEPTASYERAEQKSIRATVRTHSNERSVLYTVNPRKDKEGVERDNILPQYIGDLVHDHEIKFYNYGRRNGTCGIHLVRDLTGLRDLYKCPWADIMRIFMLDMNTHKNEDLSANILVCVPEELAFFESKYDRILEDGRQILDTMTKDECGYSEMNAMLNRLTNYKDSYMLFMRDYKVPFTNNLAERDLRIWKTKEKVSGLFRSWEGIVNCSKVRSFIAAVKKRGLDLFQSIKNSLDGEPVFT